MKARKRDRKYLFLTNLVQKIKIVNLSWNLVPRLIRLCRTQWWYLLFLFLTGNIFYWQIWFRKSNLSNFSHNLLRPSQFLKKFMEILQCSTWQKSQAFSPQPDVSVCWKSSNTEACAKKLANSVENGGRGTGLRIYELL